MGYSSRKTRLPRHQADWLAQRGDKLAASIIGSNIARGMSGIGRL